MIIQYVILAVLGYALGYVLPIVATFLTRWIQTDLTVIHPHFYAVVVKFLPIVSAIWVVFVGSWQPILIYSLFILIILLDIQYHIIPDLVTYPAILIVGAFHIMQSSNQLEYWLGGGIALAIFLATYLIRPGGLGGGDVKLAVFIGLLLGFPGMLWALLLGASAGAAWLIALALSGSTHKTIPYGPFLCLGALIIFQVLY